jgi:hypothetical protein
MQEGNDFHREAISGVLKDPHLFRQAREQALRFLRDLVQYHLDQMWLPDGGEEEYFAFKETEEYSQVRHEIWDMVRICCLQEGKLLEEAIAVLKEELHEDT